MITKMIKLLLHPLTALVSTLLLVSCAVHVDVQNHADSSDVKSHHDKCVSINWPDDRDLPKIDIDLYEKYVKTDKVKAALLLTAYITELKNFLRENKDALALTKEEFKKYCVE